MKCMLKLVVVSVLACLAGCAGLYPGVGNEVTWLATGFKFTEGPALAPWGDIYFSDIPDNRIYILSAQGRLSWGRENTGGANGLMFDPRGNLVICEGGNRRVTLINSENEVVVLADAYNGRKLNSPNDLWIDSMGGIYFTDPRYGQKQDDLEQDGQHVYYLPQDGGGLKRVVDDMVKPNGIIGTPDGRTLYIADHGGNKLYSYRIDRPGVLTDKKLFADTGSDGLTLDSRGNLYVTTDAVYVYSPEGKLLRKIEVPERPSNVCFGQDGKTLFITARTSLYALRIER